MFIYVSLALVALTAFIVLFNLLKGLIRGFKKTIGTLAAIIISAIIAAIATAVICQPDSSIMKTVIATLQDMIASGELGDIFEIDSLFKAVSAYISMIAAPFVFMVLYMVISIIVSIIVGIVIRFIPPRKKMKGVLHRLGGLGVGVVCGLLVSALLLMPVVGVLNTVIYVADKTEMVDAESDDEMSALLKEASEDKIFAVYSVTSGWMFDSIAATRYEGQLVYLKDEITAIIEIVGGISAISGEVDEMTEAQVDAFGGIVTSLDGSKILKNTVADVLNQVSSKWLADETFAGIEKIDAGEIVNPVIDSVLEVLATTDDQTITDDMNTFVGLLRVMVTTGILENVDDFEALLTVLSSEDAAKQTPISKLLNVVNDNPRMSGVSDSIAKLSVRALASTLGIPENDDETYNMLMNDIADAYLESAGQADRVAFVEEELISALDTYGIVVGGDAATDIAVSLIDDLDRMQNYGDTIDGDAVKEFFKIYAVSAGIDNSAAGAFGNGYEMLAAGAGLSENENGELVLGDYVFKHYHGYNYRDSSAYIAGNNGVDFQDAGLLYTADAIDFDIITLEEIFSAGVVSNFGMLDSASADVEIAHISKMISMASTMDFDNDDYTVMIKDMGGILDEMSAMQLVGKEATGLLLKAILQSESIRDIVHDNHLEGSVDKIVETSKKTTFAETTTVLGTFIGTYKNATDENVSSEKKIENTKELLATITPDTADLVKDMVSEEMMKKYVKNEEKAQTASNTASSLVDNMADLDKNSADYDTEAGAVNTLVDLATNATESDDKKMFSTEGSNDGKLDATPEEFVKLIVNSEVASKTVRDTLEEDGDNPYGLNMSLEESEQLSNELLNHYNENKVVGGDNTALVDKLTDVAKLMNVAAPEFN